MKQAPIKKAKATKATTTKKNTTAEAAAPNRAVERIAAQLDITTENAATKLQDLAILHVDDNLAMEEEPFLFTGCCDPFSPTAALAKMTRKGIQALEQEHDGKHAQRILYELDCTARGVIPEGADSLDDIEDLLASAAESRDIPTEIKIPAAVYRLAKQLGRDAGELARDIMQAGVEALDNGLASKPREDFAPVCFIAQVVGYSHFKEFTITGWLDRMSPELLADCQKEADECDQTLQEIVRERCIYGANLELLAQPVI